MALIQAEKAISVLGVEGDIKVVKTKGDRSKKDITMLGGRAFTRELDDALLAGDVDLTVHSLKDVPVEDFPNSLEIACVVERANPFDCLVSNGSLKDLPVGSIVGASSERRKAELLNLRGDLKVKSLRGNVPTRVGKLDSGEYDAIIVAKCALDRLGLGERATHVFNVSEMVPAAGQGAIAVVKRRGFDFRVPDIISSNFTPCFLERFFITGLGACRAPVGVYCYKEDGNYYLAGLVYKNQTRLTPTFKGSMEDIKEDVSRWKREYAL